MIGCSEEKERAREVSILPTATQCMSTRSTLTSKPMKVKQGGKSNACTVYPTHRIENYQHNTQKHTTLVGQIQKPTLTDVWPFGFLLEFLNKKVQYQSIKIYYTKMFSNTLLKTVSLNVSIHFKIQNYSPQLNL